MDAPTLTNRSTRNLFVGMAALAACFGGTEAQAQTTSFGCTNVNLGFYNSTYINQNGRQIPNFAIGDRLSITVSSITAGTFTLKNSASVTRLSWTAPGTKSYTVANAADAASLLLANDNSSSSTVVSASSCNVGPAPSPSGDISQAVTRVFMQTRINGILLNNPGATSLINRSRATGPQQIASAGNGTANAAAAFGSAMALGAGFGDATGRGASRFEDADDAALGSRNIQFRNSLSQLRREAAERRMETYRMALGAEGGALPIIYEAYSPWDVWVEGSFSSFNDDATNLDRDGRVGVLYVGGDYRITPDMIIGGLVQFDWAKDDSAALNSKVNGTGWMIGPYVSARVYENIYLDLRASWGRSSNDIDVGGAAGSFDTTRWLVRGALAGDWHYDAWRITPSAEIAYVKESSDSYTNTATTFVPGQRMALGRVQFGPEIGYRFMDTQDSFFEPFGALRGVWDFDSPRVAVIDGFVVGPGDFWGRLEGGLNWVTSSGLFARGSATWDGIGTGNYNGYTLQGTINVPLN